MSVAELPHIVVPNPSFRRELEAISEEQVSACFQCEKCTNGCPISSYMDIVPHKLMRCIHLGLKEEALRSYTIWLCASCETCTARCPNGIDIAHIMDTLRQMSQREGVEASQYNVPIFHSAFLGSVKRHGRVHEGEMAITYSFENESWLGIMKIVGLGFGIFLKGKVKLRPSRVRAIGQIRNIFKRTVEKG